MFKHCFKDRRPCCQINTNVIIHQQFIKTDRWSCSCGQIQNEQTNAKQKDKITWLYTELWLYDSVIPQIWKNPHCCNSVSIFLLLFDTCKRQAARPSPACCGHQGQTGAEGWVGPCCWAPTRRKELSTAWVGHGGASIHAVLFLTRVDKWTCCSVPTCQDGFVAFKLLPSDVQAAVGEARLLPQVPQVVRQLTLRDFKHVHVGLAWNVHRVLDDAHLQGQPDQTESWQTAAELPQQQERSVFFLFDEHNSF